MNVAFITDFSYGKYEKVTSIISSEDYLIP